MLHSSGIHIRFLRSLHFKKLILLVHGFAVYMVCSTSFILVLKIGFILTLFYSAIKSIRSLSEGPLQQLEYLGQKWSLEKKDGQSYVFKNLNIILEAGIFFLMSFSNPGEDNDNEVWHKKIVCLVFFDQLSREEYRKLCIISRAC